MDIIQEYVEEAPENKKLKISSLFKKKRVEIRAYNSRLPSITEMTWQELETAWLKLIDSYLEDNADIQIRKDSYLVDFSKGLNKAKMDKTEADISSGIVDGAIQKADSAMSKKKVTPPVLSSKAIQTKINKKTKSLAKNKETTDLLSTGVLYFVSNNRKNGTMQVLGKHYKYFQKIYNTKQVKSKRIGNLCNEIITFDKDRTLQDNIDLAKERVDKMSKEQLKKKIDASKIIKILNRYNKRNAKNEFEGTKYNETEYFFFFIEPIFRHLLGDSEVNLKCGESYLKVAAKDENDQLCDEDHRAKGPRIDMIIGNNLYNIDIATVEVSGQNNKTNQAHFIGDRFKLAKNMKIILTHILAAAPFASPIERRKLTIYSFQIYSNALYIYSLHQPDDKSFVFLLERKFPIPINQAKLSAEFTLFVSNMWIIEKLISDTNNQIEVLLQNSRRNLVLSSNSGSSSGEDSDARPRKSRK